MSSAHDPVRVTTPDENLEANAAGCISGVGADLEVGPRAGLKARPYVPEKASPCPVGIFERSQIYFLGSLRESGFFSDLGRGGALRGCRGMRGREFLPSRCGLRGRSPWAGALALVLLCVPAGEAARTVSGTVHRVLDGDTAIVQTSPRARLRCRLLGIDAPEVSHRRRQGGVTPGQPFGPEAKRALEQWALRRQVTVEVHGRDRYRRSLCVLFAGGRNLNLEVVREGYAWAEPERWSGAPPALRRELEAAAQEARQARCGLWADPNPEAPWAFRRRMRRGGR